MASSDAGKVRAALGAEVRVSTPLGLATAADIDLVVIATPNDTHHPLARAALQSGRHVVIDKPFALDAVQARDLVRVACGTAGLLSVFHNRRWDSDYQTLRNVVSGGRLGRVVEWISHFDRFRPAVRPRWREGGGPGAGLWPDLGPHLLDQVVQCFGMPQAISLDTAAQRDGARSTDWFAAVLRWSGGPYGGLRARLSASLLAASPGPRFVVHGTAGSFTIDGLDAQEDVLKSDPPVDRVAGADWGRDPRPASLIIADRDGTPQAIALPLVPGRYPSYYAAIRDAIQGQGANPVPAEQALQVQVLLDLGLRSATERCEMAVAD